MGRFAFGILTIREQMKSIIHLAYELVQLGLVPFLWYIAYALVLEVEVVISFSLVGRRKIKLGDIYRLTLVMFFGG